MTAAVPDQLHHQFRPQNRPTSCIPVVTGVDSWCPPGSAAGSGYGSLAFGRGGQPSAFSAVVGDGVAPPQQAPTLGPAVTSGGRGAAAAAPPPAQPASPNGSAAAPPVPEPEPPAPSAPGAFSAHASSSCLPSMELVTQLYTALPHTPDGAAMARALLGMGPGAVFNPVSRQPPSPGTAARAAQLADDADPRAEPATEGPEPEAAGARAPRLAPIAEGGGRPTSAFTEGEGDEDDDEEATDPGASSGADARHEEGRGLKRPSSIGRPLTYRGNADTDRRLTDDDRRRLKRREANRESARRVRQKRQELMDDLQSKCTVLTQQNARLLSHVASVEQQRQQLSQFMQLLRGRFALKANENARLAAEGTALRAALAERGVAVDLLLANVQAAAPAPPPALPPTPAAPADGNAQALSAAMAQLAGMVGSIGQGAYGPPGGAGQSGFALPLGFSRPPAFGGMSLGQFGGASGS